MATTANFSQSELVELVWTNRDTKTFSVKKKELQAMDIEQLLAVAEENSINIEPADSAVASPDLQSVGVYTVVSEKGTTLTLMDLKLVKITPTFTCHFEYQDKLVVVNDGDLKIVINDGFVKEGDMVPFHYHGVDTWKRFTADKLIANNSGDRAKEHGNSGTVAKMFFAPTKQLLDDRTANKAQVEIQFVQYCAKNNIDKRTERQIRAKAKAVKVDSGVDFLLSLQQ